MPMNHVYPKLGGLHRCQQVKHTNRLNEVPELKAQATYTLEIAT